MAENQDPATVDPSHYKVEFENERLRVVRVSYGPGEESVMHSHPNHVAVLLTDAQIRFEFPDGSSEEAPGKAGDVMIMDPTTHRPVNAGSEPLRVILVELKG
jgi:quercetin dioxygenase-like cupin family protein